MPICKMSSCVSLSLFTGHNQEYMCNAMEPLLHHFDPNHSVIKFECKIIGLRSPITDDNDQLLATPALAIMLYAPEKGHVNVDQLRSEFNKPFWSLHHTVKLQKKSSQMHVVGQQDFYEISPDLPLCSVCPTLLDIPYLRINIFVTKYKEMVDFYRLITNAEMESNKAGFCFFQLESSCGKRIQFSLKHCPTIRPIPLPLTCLSFTTRDVSSLPLLIKSKITIMSPSVFSVLDPDGNRIQIVDLENSSYTSYSKNREICALPKTCFQNHSDSQDSGLFSDCDQSVKPDNLIDCDCRSVDTFVFNLTGEDTAPSVRHNKYKSSITETDRHKEHKDTLFSRCHSTPSCFFGSESLVDFEDPWDGSQYNEEVNPSRKYKILKLNKTSAKESRKQLSYTSPIAQDKATTANGHKSEKCQNIAQKIKVSKNCGHSGQCREGDCFNNNLCVAIPDSTNIKFQRNPQKLEFTTSRNQKAARASNTDTERSFNEKFYILPDEGYRQTSACTCTPNLPFTRPTSCDKLALRSFRKPRTKSVFHFLSDKFLSKEKKFICGSQKTLDRSLSRHSVSEFDKVFDLNWCQSPKLYHVLGGPNTELIQQPNLGKGTKPNVTQSMWSKKSHKSSEFNGFSDSEVAVLKKATTRRVDKKRLVYRQDPVTGSKFRIASPEKQIGSLVCL